MTENFENRSELTQQDTNFLLSIGVGAKIYERYRDRPVDPESFRFTIQRTTANGGEVQIWVNHSPIRDNPGHPTFAVFGSSIIVPAGGKVDFISEEQAAQIHEVAHQRSEVW